MLKNFTQHLPEAPPNKPEIANEPVRFFWGGGQGMSTGTNIGERKNTKNTVKVSEHLREITVMGGMLKVFW